MLVFEPHGRAWFRLVWASGAKTGKTTTMKTYA
jgi:hypothetical protein